MTHFFDYNGPKGYLEIIKTENGKSEVIFSDHNDICIGMGQTLAGLFDPNNTNKDVLDYRIRYFQLGKVAGTGASATRACSSVFNGADYGTNTSLNLVYRKVYADTPATQAMAVLADSQITRGGSDRISYSITLDQNTANTTISEIALLSHEPIEGGEGMSPIVAYRTFPTITKTSSFDLTIKWTIEF
jgi:hypothetical protein